MRDTLEVYTPADLRAALASPKKLQALSLRLLLLGGQHYVNCGFFRHAALLQLQIAAAHLQRGDSRECELAIHRMLPLFLKEPWTDVRLNTNTNKTIFSSSAVPSAVSSAVSLACLTSCLLGLSPALSPQPVF